MVSYTSSLFLSKMRKSKFSLTGVTGFKMAGSGIFSLLQHRDSPSHFQSHRHVQPLRSLRLRTPSPLQHRTGIHPIQPLRTRLATIRTRRNVQRKQCMEKARQQHLLAVQHESHVDARSLLLLLYAEARRSIRRTDCHASISMGSPSTFDRLSISVAGGITLETWKFHDLSHPSRQ